MEMHYTKVIAKVEAGIGILASCVLEELEDFAIPLLPGLVIVAASAALSLPGRSLSGNALALALEHLERRRERERESVWMRVTGGTLDLLFIRGIFRDFTIVSLMSSSMISLIWFCVSSFFPYLARPFYIAFFFVVNLHFRS